MKTQEMPPVEPYGRSRHPDLLSTAIGPLASLMPVTATRLDIGTGRKSKIINQGYVSFTNFLPAIQALTYKNLTGCSFHYIHLKITIVGYVVKILNEE